jgi:ABC-type glutathione transport system ATPase component
MNNILEAKSVTKVFLHRQNGVRREIRAVSGVSMSIRPGEIVGLVGESGSGKTTLARMLIGIEKPSSGEIQFEGVPIQAPAQWKDLRCHVQYVFQDPFTSLCPTMRIGDALREPLTIHNICPRSERDARVSEMLENVGLHSNIARRLPSQLSGGQRQRVNLARSLMMNPRILICDEIVSGLDVSVQAQVLQLLIDLQRKFDLGLVFISHDLRVVNYLCASVLVMFSGEIIEQGETKIVFGKPQHEYTKTLLASIPRVKADELTQVAT